MSQADKERCSSTFMGMASSSNAAVVPASGRHTATVIFLHGLGDTGHGWSPVFKEMIRESHVKYICPHAPNRPVTLNMGMVMPAWFDIAGLSIGSKEDDAGIRGSAKKVHELLEAEVKSGTPAERIVLGGFSMGGALALYAAYTYPLPLAGIVALSSFLVGRDQFPGKYEANLKTRTFQGHGDSDPLVAPAFGQLTSEFIKKFNPNHTMKVYHGLAHSTSEQELADVKAFLASVLPSDTNAC